MATLFSKKSKLKKKGEGVCVGSVARNVLFYEHTVKQTTKDTAGKFVHFK